MSIRYGILSRNRPATTASSMSRQQASDLSKMFGTYDFMDIDTNTNTNNTNAGDADADADDDDSGRGRLLLKGGLSHSGIGGTAGRTSVGPPGLNYDARNSKIIIHSHERTQPIPPQNAIAHNCNVIRPKDQLAGAKLHASAHGLDEEEDLLAPFGTEACYYGCKGELCYEILNNDGTPQREVLAGHGYPSVRTSVNGLPKDTRLRCCGILAFNQKPNHDDEVGALMSNGTGTVVNTGPFVIRAGQHVYFSEMPCYYIDDAGKKQPRIQVVGFPGQSGETDFDGTTLAKFKPALYGLKDQDTAAYFHRLKREINKKWRVWFEKNKNSATTAEWEQAAARIQQEITNKHFLEVPSEIGALPIIQYAKVYSLKKAFEHSQVRNRASAPDAGFTIATLLFNELKSQFEQMSKRSNLFNLSMASPAIRYSHPILTPEVDTHFKEENTWRNIVESTLIGGVHQLIAWATDLLEFLYQDQEDFLKSHVIGIAMRE